MIGALLPVTLGLLIGGGPIAPMRTPSSSMASRSSAGIVMSTRGVVITGGAAGVGYAYADEVREQEAEQLPP